MTSSKLWKQKKIGPFIKLQVSIWYFKHFVMQSIIILHLKISCYLFLHTWMSNLWRSNISLRPDQGYSNDSLAKITTPKTVITTKNPVKLGRLPKSDEEKHADRKMQGGFQYICKFCICWFQDWYLSILSMTLILNFKFSAIQHAKDIMNTVLYLSFAPVLIIYFCCSCKKVNWAFQSELVRTFEYICASAE